MIIVFLKYIAITILILVTLFLVVAITVDQALRAKGYKGPADSHFNGSIFLNIKDSGAESHSPSLGRVLAWLIGLKKNVWEDRAVAQAKPIERVSGTELVVTMINHATTLLQTQNINIITDPIYSKRASPFSFLGPRRYTDPGIAFDDLPKIDVVLISHNHYDHLDLPTLKRLVARDNPQIIVGLGNKEFLASYDITNVVELDWWQSQEVTPGFVIDCVPAQHFSARALSDRNNTLWCGYVIHTDNSLVYFAGDTGLGPFVDRIQERYPEGFRLGLLPIGAFRPQWFMHEVHISPDEAFAIQRQLNIKDVIAIHFGTFKLADDGQDEPLNRVKELQVTELPNTTFVALNNGESVRY